MTDQTNKQEEVVNETTVAAPVQKEPVSEGRPTANTNVSNSEASVQPKEEAQSDKGESYKDKAREVTEELSKTKSKDEIDDDIISEPILKKKAAIMEEKEGV